MSEADGLKKVLCEALSDLPVVYGVVMPRSKVMAERLALSVLASPWGHQHDRLASENAALRERDEALERERAEWALKAQHLAVQLSVIREALEASAGAFAAIIHIAVTEDGRRKWAQTGFDEARAALAAHEPQEPSS